MQTVKTVIFTFCLASLCAGVLLHLFPDAAAKRCMKAVAGLYIMAALLGSVSQGKAIYSDITAQVSQVSLAASVQIESTGESSFSDSVLSQTASSLNEQYTQLLIAQGYEVEVEIILMQSEDVLSVQCVRITSEAPLTAVQQTALCTYFTQALGVSELVFFDQGEDAL